VPLETASVISDLVSSNPAASDPLAGADDHIRLIKATVKNTFPNVTGQVTASHADLNSVKTGITKLLGSGVYFDTNTTDGFKNTLAGDIDVVLQGTIAATFQRAGGVNFFKADVIQANTSITGPGMCPVGAILIWPSATLPPSTEGVFAWCNGTAYSRTTYATCYSRLGGAASPYGQGDGSTTFNVPNYQEVALVGVSGMGGATAPGLLTSIASGIKTVFNGLFGADTKTLLRSDLPNVAPTFTGTSGSVSVTGSFSAPYIANNFQTGTAPNPCSYMGNTTYNVTCTGNFTPQGTVQSLNGNVTQTAIGTVGPSRTTGFIIRLA
jgi:hypothetical protein